LQSRTQAFRVAPISQSAPSVTFLLAYSCRTGSVFRHYRRTVIFTRKMLTKIDGPENALQAISLVHRAEAKAPYISCESESHAIALQ
jgi:hypothetical protein